jgi:glutaredoxin
MGVPLQFKLYSRSNCPYKITVKRQYIDNEPELEQRYGTKVPVLTLDEQTLCEYFLDPEALLSEIENTAK